MHDYAFCCINRGQKVPAKLKANSIETSKMPVAVVGARGYSGTELCRLLLKHPAAQLVAAIATDARFQLKDVLPEEAALTVPTWSVQDLEKNFAGLHTLFLATPAEVSIEIAPKALASGVNVVDLSGAFRLPGKTNNETEAAYQKWYGFKHAQLGLVSEAAYGLQPFVAPRSSQGKAQLVANPGCFASAVLMAIVPLLKAGVIDADTIVIDAKSGTTGAGRKAEEKLLFSEVDGECRPYKVAGHQHWPEIVQATAKFAGGAQISPFFTTHLLNVRRGILASVYAKAADGLSHAGFASKVEAAFAESYSNYPLVRVGKFDDVPENVLLKRVVGSARTHISYKVDGNKLYLFSALDNLMKGAASQAVENFNQLLDSPVQLGLSGMEGVL